jgi:light-regulated signal transduction histidine kinase (bacteriophytochrome)
MSELIDDLLKLSQITRAEMHRSPVDLSVLAREIAGGLQRSEPERQVQWKIADGLSALGDPQLLRVALENLLGNAWKFTGKRTDAAIQFCREECDGQTVFCVRDNGAGFDMAYAKNLFGAFQRMHSVAEFEGMGIGLATVQRVLHRHGGRVWAEAEVDQGAAFHFTVQP